MQKDTKNNLLNKILREGVAYLPFLYGALIGETERLLWLFLLISIDATYGAYATYATSTRMLFA